MIGTGILWYERGKGKPGAGEVRKSPRFVISPVLQHLNCNSMQKDSHQLTRVWKCDRICNSQGLRHAAALGQFARSDGVLTLTKDQSYRIFTPLLGFF